MSRLKVSLIGYGFAAKAFHLPIILNNENYELKQIMTRNKTRQKEIKSLYPNVEIITSYDDAVKSSEIDLVVIATTNDVHYEYTKKALENNKNVICEKPFVPTHKEALELFELAKKNNLILKVYHNRKYNGDILTLKELMKKVDFGKLLSFERSEEHTSELQSRPHIVCRLLLEKKKINNISSQNPSLLKYLNQTWTLAVSNSGGI